MGDSGSRRGQERLVGLPASFVMQAWVLWRRTPSCSQLASSI